MKKILAIAVATAISAPAMADLTIGGSARYQADTGTNGEMGATTNRVLVAVSGSTTADSGAFVAAKATLQLSGASATTDGDNSITICNQAANVVLGYAEPAGAFNSGVDAFQNSSANAGYEGAARTRDINNVIVNITSIEGVTAQVSTDLDVQDDVRLVLGTSFGDLSATLGVVSSDNSAVAGAGLTVGTTVGGVALNASYAKADDDASSMNVNASYNGFTVAIQNDETNAGVEEQEVYGGYVVTDAAGLAGLNVTAGFGHTDSEAAGAEDTKYGVRLDYTF